MQQVTKQMGAVTKGMDKVLASMDVNQIGKVMDQFEGSCLRLSRRMIYYGAVGRPSRPHAHPGWPPFDDAGVRACVDARSAIRRCPSALGFH